MKDILIVDDSELIRNALELILSHEGFSVTAAENAEEALGILRERIFDLGIFDVNMPGKNGVELTQEVMGLPETGGMRVIMLSSETDHGIISSAVKAGAAAWVGKPFRKQQLLEVIAMLQRDS